MLTVYSVHCLSPGRRDLTAWSGEVCWRSSLCRVALCLVRGYAVCLLHSIFAHSVHYAGAHAPVTRICLVTARLPGPAELPPRERDPLPSRMATDPVAPGAATCFHTSTYEKSSTSHCLLRAIPGICCDLRSCPCAPAGLPIRHPLPGCAPVPGNTGNTNWHVAGMHSLSSLRSSYRCHCPGPDNVGPPPRHHRRANHRAHH